VAPPAAERAVTEPVSAATTAGVLTALLEVLVLGVYAIALSYCRCVFASEAYVRYQ